MSKTWRRVNKDELRAYGPKSPRKPARKSRQGGERVIPTSVKNLKLDDLEEDDFEDLYGDWDGEA